jgi:ferredoxin
MDETNVQELIDEMNAPEEAMEAFPDECANCGAGASPFFVPNDYHEQPHHKRDPGVCTECGHHFGSGRAK